MSVDSRVVTMKFDNQQFEQGAKTSLSTLDRVKQSMNFDSANAAASKGLSGISRIFAKFGLKNPFAPATDGLGELKRGTDSFGQTGFSSIEGGITSVSRRFIALSTIAVTALANITNRAVQAGISIGKSLTIDPIKQGFAEYELKLGSIQTILANTSKYGTTLEDVSGSLNDLNNYADKTIYNFAEMTKNIGLFTNAGIRLEDATSMIKGFSNEAAASGTSAQGAAGAAYQLSQALSAGTVRLMDWRSLQNVGMGNANMKQGIVDIAEAMGTLDKAGIDSETVMKDFNGSLEKGWLSADVMSTYLKIMAGDMDDAKLKSLGLTKAQIEGFAKQQKTAEDAATKVRTLTQLFGTMQEAVGSGWAQTAELVIGDFNQATDLWTAVNDTLGGMIGKMSENRNQLIKGWVDFGGRDLGIDAIANAFNALLRVLKPIQTAFREIFPRTTGLQLYMLTQRIHEFTEGLAIAGPTMNKLRRTFAGVFAVFHILWTILKQVVSTVFDLIGVVAGGSGSFLEITANIGDFLVALDEAVTKGDGLTKFFEGLKAVLSVPIALLQSLGNLIAGLFTGGGGDGASKTAGDISGAFQPLLDIMDRLQERFSGLYNFLSGLGDILKSIGGKIGELFAGLGGALASAFGPGSFDKTIDAINVGLFAAITVLFKKFLDNGLNFNFSGDLGGGMFASIKEAFGGLTNTLGAMQTKIKAEAIQKIAIAVGILTASIVVLSLIDSAALTKAMIAISAGFGLLAGTLAVLEKANIGGLRLAAATAGIIALATAMLILSLAVKVFSTMSWEELAKGLGATAVLLAALSAAAGPLSKNSKGMIRAGAGIAAMAVGILILSAAVKVLATLSWEEMGRGLAGLAGILILVAAAANAMPAKLILIGPGLVAFAGGIAIMAGALKLLATLKWEEIGKGLVALAGMLVLVAAGVALIPLSIVLIGPALITVATAITILAGALQIMGGMSWEEIAKGLVALGGSLLILAGGLYLMTGTIAGAAALVVAAGALAVLTPVLVTLGALSWESIAKGLAAIAGVFVILGLAGLALTPVIPQILLLSAAIFLLGGGIALAGVGLLAFATAITVLSVAWAAGSAIIMGAITELLSQLPLLGIAFGEMFVAFALTVAKAAPQLAKAFTKVLIAMIDAAIKVVPKVGKLIRVLIKTIIDILVDSIPRMYRAGLEILLGIMNGIADNIGKIVDKATTIVTRFIRAIGRNSGKITDAGADMIIDFIRGLRTTIDSKSGEMREEGLKLAYAIANGMSGGLLDYGMRKVREAATAIANSLPGWMKKALGINSPAKKMIPIGEGAGEGVALGVDNSSRLVENSVTTMADTAVITMRKAMSDVSDAFALNADMNPTITPVLDLSRMTKEANKVSELLATSPVVGSVSYAVASNISAETQAAQLAAFEAANGPNTTDIKVEQNNYSPKPIDPVETYRNTKSLMALLKEALD